MSNRIILRNCLASLILFCSFAVNAERFTIPLLVPAGAAGDPQGVVRILNGAQESATVTIHAIDDAGVRTGPVTLMLDALAAVELSSTELRSGNAAKGLSAGLGSLSGEVRLVIDSDVPVVPSAYVRNSDGTLAAMNATVLGAAGAGVEAYRYDVLVFHPASNATQPSRLRLINPGEAPARVTIAARDDTGAAATGGTVELTLPAGGSRTLSAQQLEAGDSAVLTGRLSAGVGNWRLSVTSDRPIQAVNVTVTPGTGRWSNLSTTAVAGWAPESEAAFEARFLDLTVVFRDGRERTEWRVLAGNRLSTAEMEDGVESVVEAAYRYEQIGRDAGRLSFQADGGARCEMRVYFESPTSGWHAFGCVDNVDRVEYWTGGTWLGLDAGAMPLDLGNGPDDLIYTVGTAIDVFTLPAAIGGDGTLTYSLSPQVPGLRFDPQMRELTGTPSEAGKWVMTYRVRDGSGDTDWRYFNIEVQVAGSEMTTFGIGETVSDLPTGSWTPDVTSNGSFLLSGGIATVNLDRGGYIEEGDYRYTCQSAGGCVIENRRVTSGRVVQTASGTAPDGSDGNEVGDFDLHNDNNLPRGIAHANGRLYVTNYNDERVYVYTLDGQHIAAADFDLAYDDSRPPGHRRPTGIVHTEGRLYVVDSWDDKVTTYRTDGGLVAAADFDLHDDNASPDGVAFANGHLYVVDSSRDKVYVYTVDGEHVPVADFDLHDDNILPDGVAHADGRLYIVDSFRDKVYAYTVDGQHVAASDFDLRDDNTSPYGIAHANGRLYVVDSSRDKVYVYTVDGQSVGGGDSSPRFAASSGPGNQTYTVGTAISALTLPAASGGDGALTYSLAPEVPGLVFNATATVRRLSGTPSRAGAYNMTYRVRDTDGDTDTLTFTITVEDTGDGGQTTTFGVGDTLSDLPTGSWTPDVTSGGSFSSSGGNVTIRLNDGGYIEEGDYRFTCQSAGGCLIENRLVSSGAIARTTAGTAPGGGGEDSDDHGDERASATRAGVGSDTEGNLSAGDVDYFRVDVEGPGTLEVYTSGVVDTVGQLEDSTGSPIDDNDDGGASTNFRIATDVDAGTYYIRVMGFSSQTAGDYTLHVRFSDSSTGSEPDDYTPLEGLRVSAGRVQYGFFSAGGCIRLNNTSINGVTYTTHSSKWQRRDSANSAWEDVSGTEQQGGLCAYNPTTAGEYRLVGEVSIDGDRGRYSSENTIVVQ